MKKRAMPRGSLIELIFSWSLQDIFNDDLYSNQVERIPETFGTLDEYFRSYTYPLLEEVRAKMRSSMEDIHNAPSAAVTSFDEWKPSGSLSYDDDWGNRFSDDESWKPGGSLLCDVIVDEWGNRPSDEWGEEMCKPGDIFILAAAKPETVSDLEESGRILTFASITEISNDGENQPNNTSTCFRVKITKQYEVSGVKRRPMFVVFLTNMVTDRRIWNALHMDKNMSILREVLSPGSGVKGYCSDPSEKYSLFDLNVSQVAAILSCVEEIKCSHKPSVQLIWGPPATGKTKTVSILLFNLVKMNTRRTLACAPTDVAVTEVASRVLQLMRVSFENDLFCPLGDILIFGTDDRLMVRPGIMEICLDYRVDKLTEWLEPRTGWRHCFNSMIDFLEDCLSQYHSYLENESRKENCCSTEGENKLVPNASGSTTKVYESFIEFARVRFRAKAGPLRRCVQTLCTHLPKKFILEKNFQDMVGLILLLDSFESLLSEDNLVPEELEKLFSQQEEVQDTSPSFSLRFLRPPVHVQKRLPYFFKSTEWFPE